MRKFLFLFSFFLLSCTNNNTNFFESSLEAKAKEYLLEHSEDLEHIIVLAERSEFDVIQWIDSQNGEELPVKAVVKKGSSKYTNVTDSSLDEIVDFSLSRDIHLIWIQRFDETWLVRKAFTFKHNDRNSEGMLTFGDPSSSGLCTLEGSNKDYGIYERVTGNWFIAKCEYPAR